MKGSRGASRPQRQARSGVTYKESDDDDDEFVPNAKLSSDVVSRRTSVRNGAVEAEDLGIAKGKRTLTLKRARTVEAPVTVGKEDVDVEERAEGKASPSPGRGLQFPQVYESAERVLNSHRGKSSAFECLLEAVSGASGDGDDEIGCSGQIFSAPKITGSKVEQPEVGLQEELTSAAYGPELLAAYSAFERKLQAVKGAKEEGVNAVRRLAPSSDEECILVEGRKSTVVTERDKKGPEDDKPSADEKKYVRRGEKVKSDNPPSADATRESKSGEEDKQDIVSSVDNKKDSETGEEDKPYNMSSADEYEEDNADAEDSWNESSDASDTENKRSVINQKSDTPAPAKEPSLDLKTSAKNSNLPKRNPGTAAHVLTPAKSTSVPPLIPKKRPALWVGTKPFVPPGPQTLQTPTMAHRRVVGLSRRHRPPPLHPYLLGS